MKMYKNLFLYIGILFSISLVLFSCEFKSYSDHEPDSYDGAFTWEEVTEKAEWGNRYDHAAVVFNDKIWVFGGYNPGMFYGDTYYEDVWSSEDGESWELELEEAPWHGRRGHEVVVFDDGSGPSLFLIGGFEVVEKTGHRNYANDVWKSKDGINWEQIKETTHVPTDSLYDWYPRMEHSCVTKNQDGKDYIFLIAGRSMQDSIDGRFATIYHNDVWRSENAINWERVDNNDFGIRGDQAVTINPESGRIYLQGGTHGFTFSAENYGTHPLENWQELWYSDNGKDWIAVNDTAAMDQDLLWRSSHKIVYYKEALWGLAGKTVSNEHYLFGGANYFPQWKYSENNIWEVDSYGQSFHARHGYASVIFNDKIWVLGGFTTKNGQDNDVWSGFIQ